MALEALGITDGDPPERAFAKMRLPRMAFHHAVANWKPNPMDTIAALMALVPSAETTQGVHVGTVHSFKGREADTVFLAGMCDAATPGAKTREDLEAERRLFYVAMTRPRQRLVVTHSKTYLPPFARQSVPTTRTRFFNEAFPAA